MAKKLRKGLDRRSFLKLGGAAVAGSAITLSSTSCGKADEGRIKQYRVLGRTGFKVSDIAAGYGPTSSDVLRYAYDSGINYFDTGESYGNGDAERQIGNAMQFMDRKNIWITTKLHVGRDDTEENLLERFRRCLERMKTDYADALFIHGASRVEIIKHRGFHSAVSTLKSDGWLKHAGLSCHGPYGREGDSMESILIAAIEDGRFDLMLLVYNFMNSEEGERVLAACKEKNIGTTAMKTSPGLLHLDPLDPDNPTVKQESLLKELEERGLSREQALGQFYDYLRRDRKQEGSDEETVEATRPFAERYGVVNNEDLRLVSVRWVLSNPDMHTVCLGLTGFDELDKFVARSGEKVDRAASEFLDAFQLAYNNRYCRHGCNLCVESCVHNLPVSTIMRYSYYFAMQRREKYAMGKYANLDGKTAEQCINCHAPCVHACPHGVNIQANMKTAHSLLTLA